MKKILVIEDDFNLSELIKMRLEENGFEVIVAVNGFDGITKVRRFNPDLVILDVMIPKMDGYKVCTILKNYDTFSKIPVIIITARSSIESKEIALQTGADSFIAKPFNGKQLVDTVNNLLTVKQEAK